MHASQLNRRRIQQWVVAALLVSAAAWTQAATCRVATTGAAANGGSTWALATTLQSALANANCGEIWIKAGVYRPTVPANLAAVTDDERAVSFAINRPLKLYGGFAGMEAALADRVLASTNPTVLSGDIDNNDVNTGGVVASAANIQGSNSFHVIVIGGVGTAFNDTSGNGKYTPDDTVIDGLTLTGGLADGDPKSLPSYPLSHENRNRGGGLFCNGSSSGKQCSPLLKNLTFIGNGGGGPAMVGYGGGLYNDGRFNGQASPTLINVTFTGNRATDGGAIFNHAAVSGNASPTLIYVTISGNTSPQGEGMYSFGGYDPVGGSGNGTCKPVIVNSIIWDSISNSRVYPDGAWTARPTYTNSVVKNAIYDGSWDSSVGIDGGGNSAIDPSLGSPKDNGGGTWTRMPGAVSSAVSLANCAVTGAPLVDQRGVMRPQGTDAKCDAGAVEQRSFRTKKLTVSVTTPNGSVTGAPQPGGDGSGSIDACSNSGGANCVANYWAEDDPSSVVLTATPDSGYGVTWGGACASAGNNPACYVTMGQDRNVTAAFAIKTYTLNYAAGANGSIMGAATQTVNAFGAGSAVTAQPSTGYRFLKWSDNSTANPRTDTNVNANLSVTASFAINAYTLSYTTDGNGSITGNASQTVDHGANGTLVTAVPAAGYRFVQWSDGLETSARTDTNVSANVSVKANFALNAYPVTGRTSPAAGGSLTCPPNPASSGATVQCSASANPGFTIAEVSGCGGNTLTKPPSPATYATGTVSQACEVTAKFAPVRMFEGTTKPPGGAGGAAIASFAATDGDETCRFVLDPAVTSFIAARAAPPPGQTLPQGMFRFKLEGCTPGSAITMRVQWPQPVSAYTKYGKATNDATAESYFQIEPPPSFDGNSFTFRITDGAKGDDDWLPNGQIVDDIGPMAATSAPAGVVAPVPTLGEFSMALLGLLAAALGMGRLRKRVGGV